MRGDTAHLTPVVIGHEFQDGVEIRQGLSGDETVIVAPPTTLHEGQAVTPAAS